MKKLSPAHINAQKAGRARDNETCQACGTKKKVHGHHVFDRQYSGAAAADNIVALCHDCHKKVHSGKIELLKF